MRVPRKLCLALALGLPAAPASAAVLYKCVLAGGGVVVQSQPCPKGSRQEWRREAAPDPEPTPEQRQQAEARRQQEAEAARSLSLLAGTTRKEPAPAPPLPPPPPPPAADAPEAPKGPCRQAHEFAAAARANNSWLELSESQLYRLDEWVARQCQASREQD